MTNSLNPNSIRMPNCMRLCTAIEGHVAIVVTNNKRLCAISYGGQVDEVGCVEHVPVDCIGGGRNRHAQ